MKNITFLSRSFDLVSLFHNTELFSSLKSSNETKYNHQKNKRKY